MGNLFFLQTIFVPPFGSNAPLWSLSFEFWYYLLFPLCLFALSRGNQVVSGRFCALAAVAVAALVGRNIMLSFPSG